MFNKKTLFFGSATAIVTPFSGEEIDYDALGKMIDFQLSQETDAIVVLGTTGEAPTIYEREREELIAFSKERIGKRVPLIVGTGSNATSVAVRYTKGAAAQGADGCLVVTPYYNKATERGIIDHYRAISQSVDIPIIIYNVPSRTGVKIPISAYEALAKEENIVAVKEASGDLGYLSELIYRCGKELDVYTGCDELILPTLALGGKGVISVISNIVPSEVHSLCTDFKNDDIEKARAAQLRLMPLIKEMFAEVNPIPIKEALFQMGFCKKQYRLPLCPSARESQIAWVLKGYSLI